MAKTDLKLYATDTQGKSTTSSITYINPEATNSELLRLGRMINNLTTNTYSKTDRINTVNCDTEAGGGSITPTLTVNPASVSLADLKSALSVGNMLYAVNVTYDGDAAPYGISYSTELGCSAYNNGTIQLFSGSATIANIITAGTVTIRADATDTYKAVEATFTVTE